MPLWTRKDSEWKSPSKGWVFSSGAWKELKEGWVFTSGAWKKIWPNTPPTPASVEYLIVGGGGGGCNLNSGSDYANPPGAGAGGYVSGTMNVIAGTSYPVVIGAGGANGQHTFYPEGAGTEAVGGLRGANSSFNGIVARGGAPALMASYGAIYTELFKNSGYGCGAGADTEQTYQGVTGGWPATDQGFGGGPMSFGNYGGGGGGAGGRGFAATSNEQTAPPDQLNKGGPGKQWVDGNYYAGGGGGSSKSYYQTTPGGIGGGGSGGTNSTAGGANTGGGGGSAGGPGGPMTNSKPGGSGVVIIRFPETFSPAASHPGATHSQSGGYHYYKFTGAGSITF